MATRASGLLLKAALGLSIIMLQGCGSLFFYPEQTVYITPDRLGLEYDSVYVDTPDGERLHGWWLPAEGAPKGTVYFLHGNAQNISSHILNVAWLPARHFNVFLIDYRGYGQSTGSPSIQGVMTDAEAGLEWVSQQAESPLFLLGQSLGGGIGIITASRWQRENRKPGLNGVVIDSSFSGFRAITREKLASIWLTWPFQVPLSWGVTDEFEGTDWVGELFPTPVMVTHSIRDGIIPFHHGQALFEAAREPKRFLETDTPHGGTFVIPAYREAMLDFMAEHSD